MRISDWSSDVCSSDLPDRHDLELVAPGAALPASAHAEVNRMACETAAFTIFLVAAYSAIRPLYGELARDFFLIEAGGIGQLLMDVAPEHGPGLCPIGRLPAETLRGTLDPGAALGRASWRAD